MVKEGEKELEEDVGTMSANDNDDFVVNKSDNIIGNPKSSEKRKLVLCNQL